MPPRAPGLHQGASYAGRRIGLLGGSFNPAHQGHRAMSLYALKRLNLDQIWWLVSPQNPLKSSADMGDFDKRVADAAKLADHPRLVVSAIEAQMGTRYTVDTLTKLRKHFPRTQFVWLMGADNLQNFHKWRDWPTILNSVPVAVFRRPAYAGGRRLGPAAQRFDKYWRPARAGKNLATMTAPAWLVLDNRLNGLSATVLRQAQRNKKRKG